MENARYTEALPLNKEEIQKLKAELDRLKHKAETENLLEKEKEMYREAEKARQNEVVNRARSKLKRVNIFTIGTLVLKMFFLAVMFPIFVIEIMVQILSMLLAYNGIREHRGILAFVKALNVVFFSFYVITLFASGLFLWLLIIVFIEIYNLYILCLDRDVKEFYYMA